MASNELPELPETSVHAALASASAASLDSTAMKNFSVRLPEALKEKAQFICERHATDLGTFLRECTRGLVKDYGYSDQEK